MLMQNILDKLASQRWIRLHKFFDYRSRFDVIPVFTGEIIDSFNIFCWYQKPPKSKFVNTLEIWMLAGSAEINRHFLNY